LIEKSVVKSSKTGSRKISKQNLGILGLKSSNAVALNSVLQNLEYSTNIVTKANQIRSLSHLIIPGIGFIKSITDEISAETLLSEEIKNFSMSGKPVLGICLGMHLLGMASEEETSAKCLKVLNYNTVDMQRIIKSQVLPHIGWNQVFFEDENDIFKSIPNYSDFYFSHSFGVLESINKIALTKYETNFVSAVRKDNVFGVQFHPERSQSVGIQLLHNFLSI
jgi:glutamine amidotransferase